MKIIPQRYDYESTYQSRVIFNNGNEHLNVSTTEEVSRSG